MYMGQTLHVIEMYRGLTADCKLKITLMDITSHCFLSSSQEPSKCLFDLYSVRRKVLIKDVMAVRGSIVDLQGLTICFIFYLHLVMCSCSPFLVGANRNHYLCLSVRLSVTKCSLFIFEAQIFKQSVSSQRVFDLESHPSEPKVLRLVVFVIFTQNNLASSG